MASTTYSVTLHHLAPGATGAGLQHPDEQISAATPDQLSNLLLSLEETAGKLTIYEPSSPEIRIKTDREVYVVRTRYRQLCFVGRESLLRGEPHSISFILGTVTGVSTEPVKSLEPARPYDRPPSATPTAADGTASSAPWIKITVLLALIVACLGTGVWMLVKPPRGVAPKFSYLTAAETTTLLSRLAGEYRTGTNEGDRRLIIGSDGTIRLAKYGAGRNIAEEIIRTVRGAQQEGKPALATPDPYLILVRDPDAVALYGQTYRRIQQ